MTVLQKINEYLNEERYEVSNKDMKKGYWKIIDTETNKTVSSGFTTKMGAIFAARSLNKDGQSTVSGKWKK